VFEEFGVRLNIRPLVDEGEAVTLDILPPKAAGGKV